MSDQAKDLVSKMLVQDPAGRLTATGCVQHEWLTVDLSVGGVTGLSPKFPRNFKCFNDKRKRSEETPSPSNRVNNKSFIVAPHKKVNIETAIGSLSLQPPIPPQTSVTPPRTHPGLLSSDGESSLSPDTESSSTSSSTSSIGDMESIFQQHDAWVQADIPFRFSPKFSPTFQAHHGFGESRPANSVTNTVEPEQGQGGFVTEAKIYSASSEIVSPSDNETFVTGNSSTLEYDTMSSDESEEGD